MTILVLGLGNILMQDEGVGVRVVEALERAYHLPEEVSVVDGGTTGMDMLDIMASHSQLIVIDAVKTGAPPGTLVRLSGDEVPAFFKGRLSPHQLGLSDLLATLRLHDLAPTTLVLIGCVPASMAISVELSESIAPLVPKLVAMVVEELKSLGVVAVPRADAA